MLKKAKKWIGYNFSHGTWAKPPREGTGESDEMKQFFKDFKADLTRDLAELGVQIHVMRSNCFSVVAVVTNGDKFVYISLSDMRSNSEWDKRVMVRSMAHASDWSGGANNFVAYDGLPAKVLTLF